ncbi:MAG: competence/damage-inducible protein A [Oscillospiraceae bacterium]|nr:competence/damage-inducible protein A [Oscillospiraceae bacterium]
MKAMSAEILCIGTEILMGNIVNTNAAYIAKELAVLGINVYHQSVVGDNPGRLREALELAFSRADIVITTGGLGPTYDDLSKETIAAWFGKKLVLHQPSLDAMTRYFEKSGRVMTENNKKQAYLPEGAEVFDNPNGTAPGCAIEKDGRIAILLPGPPREMQPMFDHFAVPYLSRLSGQVFRSHCLYFYGIGESALEDRLREMMEKSSNPTVAPYAKTGEVMLRVTARAENEQQAEALLQPAIEAIRAEAGEFLYGIDVDNLQTAAVRRLQELGLQTATAESCTGGYVAKRLTDVSGASEVFQCGLVTYSNGMKEQLLGVSHETLERYSAVSAETAAEMAAGVRRVSGADIGIGVTGNAGPNASEGKPVGEVWLAVDSEWHKETIPLTFFRHDQDAREYIRYLASSRALHLIWKTAGMKDKS